MRLLLLGHAYADPVNRDKLRALAALGCTVTAAAPHRWVARPGAAPVETQWAEDHGVDLAPIRVRGGDAGSLRWSRRELKRLVAGFRPDLLHIEEEPWTDAAAAGAALARRFHLPSTLFTWSSLPPRLGWSGRRRRAAVLRTVRGVVAGNTLAARLLAHDRPALPVAVIPQFGVTPPPVIDRHDGPGLSIGFIGRLVPERGLELLLRACVRLHGDWTLTVVGAGPVQEECEHLAERLGIGARVTWLGPLPRAALAEVWRGLDCLVVPSRTTARWVEPFGPQAVDAMAHGVPVVVSSSGALPETVADAGLVFPENDVQELCIQLQRLVDDPAERDRLALAGRHRVLAELTHDAVARQYLAFWEGLARPRR